MLWTFTTHSNSRELSNKWKSKCMIETSMRCMQAPPAPQPDRRPFFSGQAKELDAEALQRSAAAAQQLGSAIGDPASIGARLMGKMGFGVAGQGLGRSGQVRPAHPITVTHNWASGGSTSARWAVQVLGSIFTELSGRD